MVVEEEVAGPGQDLPHILKGKRTKRQRPQSPIPFTITTQYSPSGEAGCVSNGDCINNNDDNNKNDHNNNVNINIYSSSSSAEQAPSGDDCTAKTTEEDEYTARCLILLAQGQRCEQHQQHQQPVRMREPLRNKYDQDQDYGVPEKFNSKRYIETPISGNGKAGMYVYECKTCGRTFPSFQALGGHRASHKKPKNMAAEEKRLLMEMMSDDEDDLSFKNFNSRHNNNNNRISYNYNNNNSSSHSLELISSNNRGISSNSNNNSNLLHKSASFLRIHECSHCGAEFASGQALGGHMRRHMRRHRAIANTTLSLGQLSPEAMDQVSDHEAEVKRVGNGLSLDLNLPAPEDHDHLKESKFGLSSKQQKQQQQQEEEKQPALVLSTNTKLVDCHY